MSDTMILYYNLAPRQDRALQLRRALIEGYLSVLPEAAGVLQKDLAVFDAMRSLEVMTWPVSDWTPERFAEYRDGARENIAASIAHLEQLLVLARPE